MVIGAWWLSKATTYQVFGRIVASVSGDVRSESRRQLREG
jgi:hypothetical protein